MVSLPLTKGLERFLAPYDAAVVKVASAARSLIFEEAPSAMELVYDAYNAVAMGYSFTGRASDAFCHVAVYSRWVNLGFNRGVDLPDPEGLLVGSGRRVRHLRMETVQDVERPFVRQFVRAAIKRAPGSSRPMTRDAHGPRSVVRALYARKRRPKTRG